MKGGKADKLTLSKIVEIHKDKKPKVSIVDLTSQLKLGIKTEMEHTDSRKQAKEIAMDHLAENPKYYTKLKKALKRNDTRFKRSKGQDRSLPPAIVLQTWVNVTKNFLTTEIFLAIILSRL